MFRYNLNIKSYLLIIIFLLLSTDLYSDEIKDQIDKINQVLRSTNKSYIDNVESKKLVDAAIRGIIKELDPYSYYFSSEELEDINNRRNGSYYGVGFNSAWVNDTLSIIYIYPNSPAAISGLNLGDKIVRVNGKNILGLGKKAVEQMFKGDKNEILSIDIIKANESSAKNYHLRKVKLPIASIDAAYILDGTKIGYIAINRFMNFTYYEVLDSLLTLQNKGMQSLIIDLRGNPGGLVDQTYMIADEFIPDGDDIIITRGKDPKFNFRYKSSPNGKFEGLPVVLIIDSTTMSAPEIFAGAIQDLDRGLIVGKTSYGKGVVQNPIKLSDGSELWLTVAKYFTPSGRNIQKDTVLPHKVTTNKLEEKIIIKDGMNFAYNAEVQADAGYSDSIPLFKSKSGRPIYGAGGISPDYDVSEAPISEFVQKLNDKNILLKVALDYITTHKSDEFANYEKDFQSYLHNFQFDSSIDDKVKKIALFNNIEWNENQYEIDKELIYVSIKSMMAGMLWTNNEKYQIINTASNQLKKAIDVIPLAEKIMTPQKP